jgi:hypothetical protein
VIVCVPAPAVGVYVTVQFEVVVAPTCASVHDGLGEKPPIPLVENMTVPAGNDGPGAGSLSETTTVHVVDWPIATIAGKQPVTDVEVDRSVTVNPTPIVSLLAACTESPA